MVFNETETDKAGDNLLENKISIIKSKYFLPVNFTFCNLITQDLAPNLCIKRQANMFLQYKLFKQQYKINVMVSIV